MKQKIISFIKRPDAKLDLDEDLREYLENGWIIQSVRTNYVETKSAITLLYTILMNKEES